MSVATVFAEAMRADVRHTQLDARFAPLAGKVVGVAQRAFGRREDDRPFSEYG
jgi:hypothetical protein